MGSRILPKISIPTTNEDSNPGRGFDYEMIFFHLSLSTPGCCARGEVL